MDRFWNKVSKTGDCWEWTGGKTGRGYGAIKIQGKMIGAHRVSYEMAHGPIGDGQIVCHSCDNRGCVNPDHLFAADHAENMRDMTRKRRQARGSAIKQSKLKEHQISEIRNLLRGGESRRGIAEIYGVSETMIGYIARGEYWSHVQ
jgi:hypothetical protein